MRRDPRGVSLLELLVVLVLIGILAAVAVPRFSGAAPTMSGLSAARRIIAEIEWVQAEAIRTQQSQYIWFRPLLNQIEFSGLKDPVHPSRDYVINVAREMSGVTLTSANFAGLKKLTFDAWGRPDAGGTVVLTLGEHTWTITVDGQTGRARTTE